MHTQTRAQIHPLTYILQSFQELEADSLVLDAARVFLDVVALHGEVPVEVAGQLGAVTRTPYQETCQVSELRGSTRHPSTWHMLPAM